MFATNHSSFLTNKICIEGRTKYATGFMSKYNHFSGQSSNSVAHMSFLSQGRGSILHQDLIHIMILSTILKS